MSAILRLTELAAAGIDLLVLRELTGHASPGTTARYVHLSSDTLADRSDMEWAQTKSWVLRIIVLINRG